MGTLLERDSALSSRMQMHVCVGQRHSPDVMAIGIEWKPVCHTRTIGLVQCTTACNNTCRTLQCISLQRVYHQWWIVSRRLYCIIMCIGRMWRSSPLGRMRVCTPRQGGGWVCTPRSAPSPQTKLILSPRCPRIVSHCQSAWLMNLFSPGTLHCHNVKLITRLTTSWSPLNTNWSPLTTSWSFISPQAGRPSLYTGLPAYYSLVLYLVTN